jgi:hypothetical protein
MWTIEGGGMSFFIASHRVAMTLMGHAFAFSRR